MLVYKAISSFFKEIERLKNIRKNVYGGIIDEIKKDFISKTIEEIRNNREMILIEDELIIIKLRLPDKKQRLSRKDGYRLIYAVSKQIPIVIFLYVYPKNGPLQQLDIQRAFLISLIKELYQETTEGTLKDFTFEP